MSEPFIGEIRLFSFYFAPRDWAPCDGRLLSVNEYPSLFALLGDSFGGNGNTSFAVPDLRGRVPVSTGSGYYRGVWSGFEEIALPENGMPPHSHIVSACAITADTQKPPDNMLAKYDADDQYNKAYAPDSNLKPMHPGSVTESGASKAHYNMQPFLVVNFCIALDGLFPSRT